MDFTDDQFDLETFESEEMEVDELTRTENALVHRFTNKETVKEEILSRKL